MRASLVILLLLALPAPSLASREPELVRPRRLEPELVRPEPRPTPLPELVRPSGKTRRNPRVEAPRAFSSRRVDEELRARIRDAAVRAALDPRLVEAVVQVESNFSPTATSHKGAMGLMQVIPSTAEACGIHDPYNAVNNLMGACDCLRLLINRYRGNLKLALAAYNAGPGNVDRYRGIPPFAETESYVEKVLSIYRRLRSNRG